MATLISTAAGNLTGASTFATTEATAAQTSTAGNSNTGTSYAYSTTFTPANGHVMDGVLLQIRALGTGGTFSVSINNGTTDLQQVTCNCTDLGTTANAAGPTNTWTFFKFPSTVTADGVTSYKIGIKTSISANVNAMRSATTSDWTKQIRLTTTATPAAADTLYINGGITGAGTHESYTVTMDQTSSATSYGDIFLCPYGTFAYGTTASTNYYLRMAGTLWLQDLSTFTMGTSGTPMPSSSTAVLEFNCGSNVQYGMELLGTCTVNTFGASMSFVSTKLAADVAANGSSITTADTTGWNVGDKLAFASTSRTYTESETANINTISGTTITVTGGGGTSGALQFAHSGTNSGGFDTRSEVINVTRNVKIRGISTSLQAYITIRSLSTVNCQYTEFYQLGSATSLKRGIDIATQTGSSTFNACSFHDYIVASSIGIFLNVSAVANCTFTNIVSWNIDQQHFISTAGITTTTTTVTINGWVGIFSINSSIFTIGALKYAISNLTATGGKATSMNINSGGQYYVNTWTNLVSHSNNAYGITLTGNGGLTIQNIKSWRNVTSGGFNISNNCDIVLDTVQCWGNSNSSAVFVGGAENMTLSNWTVDQKASVGDALTQFSAFQVGSGGTGNPMTITIYNCISGGNFPQTNFFLNNFPSNLLSVSNSTISDGTLIGTQNTMGIKSRQSFMNFGNVTGNHKSYYRNGINSIDTTLYDVTPSLRMTPNNGSGNKLQSHQWKAAVANGTTATTTVKVRASVVAGGDAADYNGAAPRLFVSKNVAAGISSDTLLATLDSSYLPGGGNQGLWATVSGTTASVTDDAVLSFYVDCDGSTGWINIDTIVVS